MVSKALSSIRLRFKGLYFGSYQDSVHIQHEFSDCRSDTVFLSGTMISFSQGGAAKIKSLATQAKEDQCVMHFRRTIKSVVN